MIVVHDMLQSKMEWLNWLKIKTPHSTTHQPTSCESPITRRTHIPSPSPSPLPPRLPHLSSPVSLPSPPPLLVRLTQTQQTLLKPILSAPPFPHVSYSPLTLPKSTLYLHRRLPSLNIHAIPFGIQHLTSLSSVSLSSSPLPSPPL
ncbi:hypothetical protein IE53DRAFT_4418 [Violaceomyces palustris]|uniref:Uncharacterized protein n=1 Tax=Violaceomyces palustris TaxID=1673888 RepID=A0ACD0NLZ3_9BASI|nr:hypothetical protein IE53DRAFT_4418 [Violaceomyces palustris]